MGSRFLSADVGVLRPGVATGPTLLIDIATGIGPAARLERVIADMRLQLAEVIIHYGLLSFRRRMTRVPPASLSEGPVLEELGGIRWS
jgi:hypothetical protein